LSIFYFNAKPSLGLKHGARFYGDLILSDATIHSMQLDNTEFHGNILLNNSDFNRLIVDWCTIKNRLDHNNNAVYKALIKNFKELDQSQDADDCYFTYRYKFMLSSLDFLSLISCGYGVRWTHTLLFGLMCLGIFGAYYFRKSQRYELNRRDALLLSAIILLLIGVHWTHTILFGLGYLGIFLDCFLRRQRYQLNRRDALLISAIILLSIPTDWFPYEKDEYTYFIAHCKFAAIIERILGYGLLVLFIGVISRVMIRY